MEQIMRRLGTLMLICAMISTCFTACSSGDDSGNNDNGKSFDLSSYVDTYWATEGIDYTTGGYVLGINADADTAYFSMDLVQAAPGDRIATIAFELPVSEVTDNKIKYSFDEDGWGNSGDVEFILKDDEVKFTISNVKPNDPEYSEGWGFSDDSGSLVENPYAYDDLYHEEDTYYEEEYYDTTTASGILADMGMTEEEFRNGCYIIGYENYYFTQDSNNNLSKHYTDFVYSDLQEYPSNYTGYLVHDFTGSKVFQKTSTTDGYPAYILITTNQYENDRYVVVFDYRDDVYAPTISEGDVIKPYMIFTGLQTIEGTDFVCFKLISVDK